MKYRKRPVVIEAEVYHRGLEDGFECHAYESWNISKCNFDCGNGKDYIDQCVDEGRAKPYVGKFRVFEGDYIVTNEHGAKSVYSPREFHKTFEEVPEQC